MELFKLKSDLELASLMFCPKVRPLVKANSNELLSQFYDNELCKSMIEFIRDSDEITRTSLGIFLLGIGVEGSLQTQILEVYEEAQGLKEPEIAQLSNVIVSYVASVKIRDIREQYPESPVQFIQQIHKIEVSSLSQDLRNSSKTFKELRFGEITDDMMDEYLEGALPCFMPFYNKTTAVNGFFASQLIDVCGPPGGGKTMWMMNQAVHTLMRGEPVAWLALGDIVPPDMRNRMSAIICGVPINIVTLNSDYYRDMAFDLCPAIKDKLLLHFDDAEKISAETYFNFMINNGYEKEFKVNFIDYDSNFASDKDMYEKGGDTFNLANGYSRLTKGQVFIGTQPKTHYYHEEIIPEEALAESSKKPQILDVILTVSHVGNEFNHVGYLNCPKNRRGTKGLTPYFLDPSGRFIEITNQEYSSYKGDLTSVTLIPGNSKYGGYREPQRLPQQTTPSTLALAAAEVGGSLEGYVPEDLSRFGVLG